MSDTKALEGFTKKWMWLETVHGAWIYQGVPPMEQATAELAALKEDYRKVCHANSDLADIIQEKGQQVDDLRAELDEARKAMRDAIRCTDELDTAKILDAFLSAHPEEPK